MVTGRVVRVRVHKQFSASIESYRRRVTVAGTARCVDVPVIRPDIGNQAPTKTREQSNDLDGCSGI